MGGIGLVSWVVLLLTGWDRALEQVGLGAWWSDLRGWPLLAAALFAAVAVHVRSVPERRSSVAAGLALLPLVLLADAPQTPGSETLDLAIGAAALLVLGVIAFAAPRAWALGASVLAGLGVLGLGAVLVYAPWDVLARQVSDGSAPADLTLVGWDTGIAPWTYGLVRPQRRRDTGTASPSGARPGPDVGDAVRLGPGTRGAGPRRPGRGAPAGTAAVGRRSSRRHWRRGSQPRLPGGCVSTPWPAGSAPPRRRTS